MDYHHPLKSKYDYSAQQPLVKSSINNLLESLRGQYEQEMGLNLMGSARRLAFVIASTIAIIKATDGKDDSEIPLEVLGTRNLKNKDIYDEEARRAGEKTCGEMSLSDIFSTEKCIVSEDEMVKKMKNHPRKSSNRKRNLSKDWKLSAKCVVLVEDIKLQRKSNKAMLPPKIDERHHKTRRSRPMEPSGLNVIESSFLLYKEHRRRVRQERKARKQQLILPPKTTSCIVNREHCNQSLKRNSTWTWALIKQQEQLDSRTKVKTAPSSSFWSGGRKSKIDWGLMK